MVENISFQLAVCRSACLSLVVFRLKTKEGLVKTSWKGTSLCNIGAGSHNEGLMLYSVPRLLCVHVQEVHHYYTITHLLCTTSLKTYTLNPVVTQELFVCSIENKVVSRVHSCHLVHWNLVLQLLSQKNVHTKVYSKYSTLAVRGILVPIAPVIWLDWLNYYCFLNEEPLAGTCNCYRVIKWSKSLKHSGTDVHTREDQKMASCV